VPTGVALRLGGRARRASFRDGCQLACGRVFVPHLTHNVDYDLVSQRWYSPTMHSAPRSPDLHVMCWLQPTFVL
jgi:hypothetical protein